MQMGDAVRMQKSWMDRTIGVRTDTRFSYRWYADLCGNVGGNVGGFGPVLPL